MAGKIPKDLLSSEIKSKNKVYYMDSNKFMKLSGVLSYLQMLISLRKKTHNSNYLIALLENLS